MAEKRIVIMTNNNDKNEQCRWVNMEGCHVDDNCAICNVGITRQEAIDRMAKAIYDFEIIACSHEECGNKQCENCETWKWCEKVAEAALNALLEVEK